MFDMFMNEQTLMLFIVAVIFTAVGWFFGIKSNVKNIVAATIDSLIDDGYLKTKGTGSNMEILKWREWENTND